MIYDKMLRMQNCFNSILSTTHTKKHRPEGNTLLFSGGCFWMVDIQMTFFSLFFAVFFLFLVPQYQEAIIHANGNKKIAGVARLVSDKIDYKTKSIIKDKGHYIMIKRSIQEDIIHKHI